MSSLLVHLVTYLPLQSASTYSCVEKIYARQLFQSWLILSGWLGFFFYPCNLINIVI